MGAVFQRAADRIIAIAARRPPDEVIDRGGSPYINRWYLIRCRWLFNLYLHQVLRSDDDAALHDHPWANATVVLRGGYIEETIRAGGIHRRVERRAGSVKARLPWTAHRLELCGGPCWSLFATGPKTRAWGFHCRDGWVHWREYKSRPDRPSMVEALRHAADVIHDEYENLLESACLFIDGKPDRDTIDEDLEEYAEKLEAALSDIQGALHGEDR